MAQSSCGLLCGRICAGCARQLRNAELQCQLPAVAVWSAQQAPQPGCVVKALPSCVMLFGGGGGRG